MSCYFGKDQLPGKGEHLIIADIGGGTCDVGIYAVEYSDDSAYPQITERVVGQGINVGSTKIDEFFENKVGDLLKPSIRKALKDSDEVTVTATAAATTCDVADDETYRAAKHNYWAPPHTHLASKEFPLRMDALRAGTLLLKDDLPKNFRNNALWFNKQELFKPAFEEQCRQIWNRLVLYIKELIVSQPPRDVVGQNPNSEAADDKDLQSLENHKYLKGLKLSLILFASTSDRVC